MPRPGAVDGLLALRLLAPWLQPVRMRAAAKRGPPAFHLARRGCNPHLSECIGGAYGLGASRPGRPG